MAMTLITTNTHASSVTTSTFTSGIDSTYKLYIFKFYDINPDNDNTLFRFQANASSQSGYNEVITSTNFYSEHTESDSTAAVAYDTGGDQAQGTADQNISSNIGNGADESCAGELFLFNPSSTTYATQFYSRSNTYYVDNRSVEIYVGGYFNVTAAITNIQFDTHNGDFTGVIKMYGVG
jgi:hypothetical protein